MTRAETRTWYRIALSRPGGAPRLVAAAGEHMGQAIAAAEHEVAGSFAIGVEKAADNEIPLGESVGKGHVVLLGDAPEMPVFQWPRGVVPALTGGIPGAAPGWMIRPDDNLLVMEAQTDAEHLIDLFLGIIERLPTADNLEVRVLDHFEDSEATDVWLTARVNAKKVLRFLDDYDVELINNGHVELSVYVRSHKATLRLTEHKSVVWLAEGRALEAEVATWFRELHVPHVAQLVTVRDMPHFHYRAAKSRDRKKLGEELYRQRLRKVDVVKAAHA
ncbi:MAG: hypothetical protein JWO36_7523 [Myxococcales bacterium]|nr:hypothetical protein [Myxococcales bacterium]